MSVLREVQDSHFHISILIAEYHCSCKMRSRNASMSTLANYKEKASKFQRAINLINVIMIIEAIFLINQGKDLFNFYHLGQVDCRSSLIFFYFHPNIPTAQLLVSLLCLVPILCLCPWSLPLCDSHLQHRGGQPAQQQQPQLQNPCRTHRCPLQQRLLRSNFHGLLCCEVGCKYQDRSNHQQCDGGWPSSFLCHL